MFQLDHCQLGSPFWCRSPNTLYIL